MDQDSNNTEKNRIARHKYNTMHATHPWIAAGVLAKFTNSAVRLLSLGFGGALLCSLGAMLFTTGADTGSKFVFSPALSLPWLEADLFFED